MCSRERFQQNRGGGKYLQCCCLNCPTWREVHFGLWCGEKQSVDAPLAAASAATSAALLATTCVWIWLIGFATFSQETVIVGSSYTYKKKKIPMSVHCELRHVPKVLSKKITKLSGRRLNQVEAEWIKPEDGTLHFWQRQPLGSTDGKIGRVVRSECLQAHCLQIAVKRCLFLQTSSQSGCTTERETLRLHTDVFLDIFCCQICVQKGSPWLVLLVELNNTARLRVFGANSPPEMSTN